MAIRVLLADDHPAVRAGIRGALVQAQDIEVIAEARDGEEALRWIEQVQPDVVLLDCRLPGALDGVTVAQRIRAAGWPVRVVALSAFDDDKLMYDMLWAKATGYLLKQEALEQVVEAVRAVARGQRLWTDEQIVRARRWWDRVGGKLATLSAREREVLVLMTEALSNQEIAGRLGLSENTVETHVRHILSKLGLNTRQEAIVLVLRQREPI